MSEIELLLHEDSKFRKAGASGDLYVLDGSFKPMKWDFSLPTLCSYVKIDEKRRVQTTIMNEMNKLNLEKIDMSNILLAGGCVLSFFNDASYSDLDFFIYGINKKEDATKRALKFFQDMEVDQSSYFIFNI